MTWIGDLSAPPEGQTLVNINMVRYITADQEEDGTLLVDGALTIDHVRELFGGGALPNEELHDYHTAAGMTIAQFGRIPHTGESFQWAGWRVEVVDLDGPRVDKLLLQRLPAPAAGDDD